MCGIAGDIDFEGAPNRAGIELCCESLKHRGPDNQGIWEDPHVVLGHRRLSIIDVGHRSDQPMLSPDGRYVIVFNGEIYNFPELRRELDQKGERFITSGDAEVLLRLYMLEQEKALERLNGMFAFAIWDRKRRTLFAARDRFGEKPFYYWTRPAGRGLVFASQLDALIRHPDVPRKLDPQALGNYLANSYIFGNQNIFHDVLRLPAAHWLRLTPGKQLEVHRYWNLAEHYGNKLDFASEAAAGEALKEIVDDAVNLRLISDVPLGAFLSGGVDSSIIVSSMARCGSRESVRTYSMGFAEDGFSELPFARSVARQLGVKFIEDTIKPKLLHDISRVAAAAGEPFADTSIVPTYYLARHARRQVTVALSGDGGDELFAGYETYIADKLHRWVAPTVRPLAPLAAWIADNLVPVSHRKVGFDYRARQFARGLGVPSQQAHWHWRNIFDLQARMEIVRDHLRLEVQDDGFDQIEAQFAEVAGAHPLDQACYVDIKSWLVDSVLVKVDRASMAHSLESRAPFLDHRLAEFSARLPVQLKLSGFRKKFLLRRAFADRFEPETLDRPKQGFLSPVSDWLNGTLRPLAQDIFASTAFTDIFCQSRVESLYNQHLQGKADHGQRLFNLLMFGLWRTACLASPPSFAEISKASPEWRCPSLSPR
jgi:asparagine synthase (glutamine-hydrolysing)